MNECMYAYIHGQMDNLIISSVYIRRPFIFPSPRLQDVQTFQQNCVFESIVGQQIPKASKVSSLLKVICQGQTNHGNPFTYFALFFNLFLTCKYVNVPCACSTTGGQKRASDTLTVELWMAVSNHMGARNQTLVFCKSRNCCKCLSQISTSKSCE